MASRNIGAGGSRSLEYSDFASPSRRHITTSNCLVLTDSEPLECCVCYEPLTVPVFQCPEGHLVCSCCHSRLNDTCPCCRMTSGYNRARAVEKILSSLRRKCHNAKFGCSETTDYDISEIPYHFVQCDYEPCDCPFFDCDFVGSWRQLGKHVDDLHGDHVERFDFVQEFKISIPADEECAVTVLRERETNSLFPLYNRYEPLGNVVFVCHITPWWHDDQYVHKIKASSGDRVIELQTSLRHTERRINHLLSEGYLVVPPDFTGRDGRINLYISIRADSEWSD